MSDKAVTHQFKDCTIDLRGAGYACVSRGDEFEIGHTGEGDRVLIDGDTLDFTGLHILGPVALADRIKAAVALECYALATERDALRGELARLTAERDDATRAKDCFQRMTRAHWEALCAMRNSINEYIPMPNTDSGPLFSPEDGPIYADIAERVIADLAESRAYALALEQELRDRARLTAERDTVQAGAVKVKPLVWFETQSEIPHHAWEAWTGFGRWVIFLRFQSSNAATYWLFSLEYPTLDAAKAAAQADYEARILAAIQPAPEARQAALAKAWTMATAAMAERAKSELSAAWAADLIVQWAQSLTPPADLAAKIGGE